MRLTKEFFQKCGAKGGKIGGPARAKKLSKKRRSEIARMGGIAGQQSKRKNGGT